jgi:hypothetical protein
MPSIHDQPGPGTRGGARARAPTILGVALALVLLAALAALTLRSPPSADQAAPVPPPEQTSPTAPLEPGSPQPAAPPLTAPESSADVAARLRHILQVREEAFGRRDMRLLETVYTADCPCLRSGRAAIARLLTDRAVWRGRAIAVEVSGVDRVSERIWVAVARFSSRPFRIEREDGALIRAAPAERQRYRFVLVRSVDGRWLLGDALLLDGAGP